MGRLTTHVLDTARGRPAGGLALELRRGDGCAETLLRVRTTADGRTPEPLLEGGALVAGPYELVFALGDYFASWAEAPDPPFFDVVSVRIVVADPSAHYHVPLLASPWAYSTYRGS